MRIRPLLLAVTLAAASPTGTLAAGMSYMDNGVVRVGVDLSMGGVITYLSRSSDSYNVINSFDLGREVQQSYYAGPTPYGNASPDWANWPWNPIGAGDAYGNRSVVTSSRNDGRTLYVRTIPKQWALNNVACECFFETWITLDGSAVNMRYRLTNHRGDLTAYDAYGQELPAVYTIGALYRIFTYDAAAPFTGDSIREVPFVPGPPWQRLTPTENWVALVNDSGWGLGVLNRETNVFLAGFSGAPNSGGPHDNQTGYIAPVGSEILDHNIAFDYEASLVLGTLAEIRSYALEHRRAEARPDLHFDLDRFQEDRQHMAYFNARDEGLPLKDRLRVALDQVDPQVYLPSSRWDAATMPVLFVHAAFHTQDAEVRIFWSVSGADFDEMHARSFAVVPDGQFRTYAFPLSASPKYAGPITGLRVDPGSGGHPGDFVDIAWISFHATAQTRSPRIIERRGRP